jgi:hypothetical protein
MERKKEKEKYIYKNSGNSVLAFSKFLKMLDLFSKNC